MRAWSRRTPDAPQSYQACVRVCVGGGGGMPPNSPRDGECGPNSKHHNALRLGGVCAPLGCAVAPGLQLDTLVPEAQLKAPGTKVAICTHKLYATSSSLRPTARSSTLGMARSQHLGEICSTNEEQPFGRTLIEKRRLGAYYFYSARRVPSLESSKTSR